MDSDQFIRYLNRGGYGYYWIKHPEGRKETIWFDPEKIPPPPDGSYDLYFGVNPSRVKKTKKDRVNLLDVCAINCLLAEFDSKDFEDGKDAALQHILELKLPPSVMIDSGGGYHCYWLLGEPVKINDAHDMERIRSIQMRWVEYVGGDTASKDLARVLRVPGSYNLKYDPPREVKFISADYEMPYYLDDLEQAMPKPEPVAQPTNGNGGGQAHAPMSDAAQHWISKAMDKLPTLRGRHETGFWLACQLRDAGMDQPQAEGVYYEWVSRVRDAGDHPYTDKEAAINIANAFKGVRREPARDKSKPQRKPLDVRLAAPAPTVKNSDADQHPPEEPPMEKSTALHPPEEPPVEKIKSNSEKWPMVYRSYQEIKGSLDHQERGDADLLAALYVGMLVYDHAESAWYIWKGHYWQRDETGEVYQIVARRVAPQYLHAAADAKADGLDDISKLMAERASKLNNKKRIDNVLYLAARHEDIRLTGNEWDANPWLLGCQNGVIELNTGKFRPGKPEDYIRSYVKIDWVGIDAPAIRYERFINEVLGEDQELVRFTRRLLGYGITGLSSAKVLPIFWGEVGNNGKTTWLEILSDILGSNIAASTDSDALMSAGKHTEGPKPFIYGLRGKRLVWASESEDGARINVGLVKQLTGNDELTVRTLHSKPVTFKPTHLIILLTNRKPHIPGDDKAMWNRVKLIPFNESFEDNPIGPHQHKAEDVIKLKEQLMGEGAGILAWLVRGCLEWQAIGLNPPDSVNAATDSYREEEDTLGQYINERCRVEAGLTIKASALHEDYKSWAQTAGIEPLNAIAFGKQVKRRYPARLSNGTWYDGLCLASKMF